MPPIQKTDPPTKYVQLLNVELEEFATPFGPGYEVAFDETIITAGYNEIRLWVHVFEDNYETTPITPAAQLEVRFMHQFVGGSFDYEKRTIGYNGMTSYINGYCAVPIIGNELRVLCRPTGMPPGPYTLQVTYHLVR
ncbi:MAG: hypothetical protein ACQERF_01575 [Actinomycetota bacterium]